MKKILVLLLALLTAMSLFAGGSAEKAESEQVTIKVANYAVLEQGYIPFWEGVKEGFEAKYPNYKIEWVTAPYGEIVNQTEDSPTLTMNEIGRHVSTMVYTKVVTNKSPWLRKAVLDQIYAIPASHGEGRFVASKEWIEKLFKNGQVATQYVNLNGEPTMDDRYNPNGSYYAIEGITSPDGRVLGKMAHSERIGENIAKNIYAKQDQKIFESGVEYFK